MPKHCLTALVLMLVAAGQATPLMANEQLPESVTNRLRCHDGPDDTSALILETRHAVLADQRKRFVEDGGEAVTDRVPPIAMPRISASIR